MIMIILKLRAWDCMARHHSEQRDLGAVQSFSRVPGSAWNLLLLSKHKFLIL